MAKSNLEQDILKVLVTEEELAKKIDYPVQKLEELVEDSIRPNTLHPPEMLAMPSLQDQTSADGLHWGQYLCISNTCLASIERTPLRSGLSG